MCCFNPHSQFVQRGDDLGPWADAKRHQHGQQRVGPRRHTHGVLHLELACEFVFERLDLRTEDELLLANSSEGWLAFSWELIATLEKYGGNLAVRDGIDMAQLRSGHQTQGHFFNRIIPEQFKIQNQSGRYSLDHPVPV